MTLQVFRPPPAPPHSTVRSSEQERRWRGSGPPCNLALILAGLCLPSSSSLTTFACPTPIRVHPVSSDGAEFPDTRSASRLLGQSPQRGTPFLASRPAVDFTHQGQGNLLLSQLLGPGASTSWTGSVFQSWGLPSLLHKTPLFLSLTGNLYCSRAPNIPTACFLQTCTSEDGFGCGLKPGGPQRHNTHERLLGWQTATT